MVRISAVVRRGPKEPNTVSILGVALASGPLQAFGRHLQASFYYTCRLSLHLQIRIPSPRSSQYLIWRRDYEQSSIATVALDTQVALERLSKDLQMATSSANDHSILGSKVSKISSELMNTNRCAKRLSSSTKNGIMRD